MGEIRVLDASPVIVLARIGRLDLLDLSACSYLLPTAVVGEILAGPTDDPARVAVAAGFLPERPAVVVPSEVLEWSLGAGESAVIAAARERGGIAVLDDADGRACAKSLGLSVIGTPGMILRARREGRIPAAAPLVAAVQAAGLHLDDDLVRDALRVVVGESWP